MPITTWTTRAATAVLTTGLLAPVAATASASPVRPHAAGPHREPGPIEAIVLEDADGQPWWTANEVNLRGQVVGSLRSGEAVVWADGDTATLVPAGTASSSAAYDINELGQVVGSYVESATGRPRPFSWQDGDLTTLGPPDTTGVATNVNERGHVLGADSATSPHGARVWDADGTVIRSVASSPLEPLTAEVNNRGQALIARMAGDVPVGAVWQPDGTVIPLGTGAATVFPTAINESGTVAGVATAANGRQRAFVWRDGQMTDLGTLGGTTSYIGYEQGNRNYGDDNALNEWGHVVGASTIADGSTHAFLWRNGQMTDLGTLGGRSSVALAINNLGQVVGLSETATGEGHAFLWEDGTMTDLGAIVGGRASIARDINDRGQVVGDRISPDLQFNAVMWTAPAWR